MSDQFYSGMYPHRPPYNHRPLGGIPTQLQTLLKRLERFLVPYELQVTQHGHWYIKLKLPYNIIGTVDRAYRLVKRAGGTLDVYPSRRVDELVDRIRADLDAT